MCLCSSLVGSRRCSAWQFLFQQELMNAGEAEDSASVLLSLPDIGVNGFQRAVCMIYASVLMMRPEL